MTTAGSVAERRPRGYWLAIFTERTWQEFRAAGADVVGFPTLRLGAAQKIPTGDWLLCYVTVVHRWVGVLEVTTKAFVDKSPIWSTATFPVRVRTKALILRDVPEGVPIGPMRRQLSVFAGLRSANNWGSKVRIAPTRWPEEDGILVAQMVMGAAFTR